MDSNLFLSSKELAEKLRVTTMTVRNLCQRGMPHMRVGNRIRYVLNDVLSWLAEEQNKNYDGISKRNNPNSK